MQRRPWLVHTYFCFSWPYPCLLCLWIERLAGHLCSLPSKICSILQVGITIPYLCLPQLQTLHQDCVSVTSIAKADFKSLTSSQSMYDSLPHGLHVLQVCLVRMISKVMHTRNSQQTLRRRLPLVLGSASIKLSVQQQAMLLGMHMQDSLQLMIAWAVNRMAPNTLLVFNRLHLLLKCPLLRPFDVLLYCSSQTSY